MLRVLHVWSDWFLFSDSYVNGLRATFLRSGNSGVSSLDLMLGDVLPVKVTASSEDVSMDGLASAEDAALAIGEREAARELLSLPLADLERRCKHNGLSSRGGREIMAARLLSLWEAEKQKNQEHDEVLESLARSEGDGRLDSSLKEYDSGILRTDDPQIHVNKFTLDSKGEILSAHNLYERPLDTVTLKPVIPTFAISPPELKAKSLKAEPILIASKWSREIKDESKDADESKGLGLSYSSSDSESMLENPYRVDMQYQILESTHTTVTDSSMDEARR